MNIQEVRGPIVVFLRLLIFGVVSEGVTYNVQNRSQQCQPKYFRLCFISFFFLISQNIKGTLHLCFTLILPQINRNICCSASFDVVYNHSPSQNHQLSSVVSVSTFSRSKFTSPVFFGFRIQ